MTADLRAVVHHAVSSAADRLRDLSHRLWSSPELGRHEHKAHAALTDFLTDLGFRVQPHHPSATAFVATYSAPGLPDNARPHVVLLCEYDALPGVGHACGHNLIAECAVAAGKGVAAAMAARGVGGRVSVVGTPAEETDGGKIDLVEAGFFADVDAAMMAHPVGGRRNAVSVRTTACAGYVAEFVGKASHGLCSPWRGVNALDAVVQAYQSVSALRQHLPPGWKVTGIITRGGEVPSVVPDRAELHYFLRAPSLAELFALHGRWRRCMDAAATASGCDVSTRLHDRPYADLRANPTLCRVFSDHAAALGVSTDPAQRFAWSTDAGNVSHVVPTIHPVFHILSNANIHERDFAGDAGGETAQRFVLQQAELLALTALSVLTDSDLRRDMRRDFLQAGEGGEEGRRRDQATPES